MNLRLSLKTKWFEMTKSGIKTEDYREINPYWLKRLLLHKSNPLSESLDKLDIEFICQELSSCNNDNNIRQSMDDWYISFKKFDYNIMTLGYPKSSDTEKILTLKHGGIEIRTGNPDWGAENGKLYFAIKHEIQN